MADGKSFVEFALFNQYVCQIKGASPIKKSPVHLAVNGA
jgi:hypothetical protein